jgi:asparagine synthase (glutamine-hydrolysing)
MKHGGPDDEGIYLDEHYPLALGHRRLSFLDLSPAGHQPMQDIEGKLQLIFNGEIYNFIQLKNELKAAGHSFKNSSDTEVILKAYLQWGTGCFERFNGMFSLALFDQRSSQLILARDHAGIKPLYYSIAKDTLYFASEVRAFKTINPQWPENEAWKIHLLTFGNLPEPVTTLHNVQPLRKGTYMSVQLPSLRVSHSTFCEFKFRSIITDTTSAVALVKEKLEKAVERHLISDAPIGLFLSGGTDSSLLTLLAHKTLKNNLHTLSIVFEDKKYSEEKFQKIIIDKTGANHHAYLVTDEEFYSAIPDILLAMDQPSSDGINSYFICKYAKEFGLKAVLSGLGADELFGGYDSFYRTRKVQYMQLLPSIVFGAAEYLPGDRKKKVSFLQRKNILGEFLLNRGFFTPLQTADILGCEVGEVNAAIDSILVPDVTNGLDRREMVSAGEQHLYMQNQLLKDTDYMSMWHGIEVRVPFLDKELLQAVHSIAPNIKYNKLQKKHLLIEAFHDILPREIYQRKKQGFTFPFYKWISKVQTTKRRDQKFDFLLRKLKAGQLQWSRYWCYLLTLDKRSIKYYEYEPKNILFLNLKAFSITGGIEKFNRSFLKALSDLEEEGKVVADAMSAYDNSEADPNYFSGNYTGFNGNRISFVLNIWRKSHRYDVFILGHINLATAGWGVKKFFAKKKLILIAHGIEVWSKLSGIKATCLKEADIILAVSNFTKSKIVDIHRTEAGRIRIFHNTIDPFFNYPSCFKKPAYLLNRYGIKDEDSVVFTLSRLSFTEKYKGYDQVIELLPALKQKNPNLRYILAGKADERELERVNEMIESHKLAESITLPGFIKDEEVIDHYLLSDVFVMPSRKEGFGIVFIEAMACGLPVVAGNIDGSVDALKQGELGTLVNPFNQKELLEGMQQQLNIGRSEISGQCLQRKVKDAFGFEVYKERLSKILEAI